jgi:hypothetical protein
MPSGNPGGGVTMKINGKGKSAPGRASVMLGVASSLGVAARRLALGFHLGADSINQFRPEKYT